MPLLRFGRPGQGTDVGCGQVDTIPLVKMLQPSWLSLSISQSPAHNAAARLDHQPIVAAASRGRRRESGAIRKHHWPAEIVLVLDDRLKSIAMSIPTPAVLAVA